MGEEEGKGKGEEEGEGEGEGKGPSIGTPLRGEVGGGTDGRTADSRVE